MNASAAFEDAFDATAADLAEAPRALLDRQLARLDRLAEAGMEMVEALVAQAKGTGPKVVEGDVGLAFGRVSRAVRLCVLLHSELMKGLDDPQPAAVQGRQAQVERAVRIVARVARDHCGKELYEVRAYAEEARERLDDDDIYGLVASRPVGELVAMVCDDLGLEPDWDHLAAEAWAQAEIDSGAKGSPFLEDDEEESDAPEPGPARPEFRPPTFQETLAALARDPEILAAARRGSG